MRVVVDVKETYGKVLFLGHSDKFEYVNGVKTTTLAGRNCRLTSSILREQFEVLVPVEVDVDSFDFTEEVFLKNVELDPYARAGEGGFASVQYRASATDMTHVNKPNSPKESTKEALPSK